VWGLGLAGLLGVLAAGPARAGGVALERLRVAGCGVNVATVDLNVAANKVSVLTARGFPGTDEPFEEMVVRTQPAVAITGTFFSVRSLLPIGDLVINGSLDHFGGMGTALAVTPDNQVKFRPVPYGRSQDWTPFETVLACGPTLLRDGQVALAPRHEGFQDPHILGRAWRVAVGHTAARKLKMVAVREQLTLAELAQVMQALGCTDAINLDGGSSTALAFRGEVVVAPGRPLVNLLVCYENVPDLFRYAPGMEQAKARREAREQQAFNYFNEAQQGLRANEREKALAALAKATELHADNGSYHLAYADALRPVALAAEVAAALARAGRAYLHKGRYEQAVEVLTEAVALNVRHLAAREWLIQAYQALGRTAEAERHRQALRWTRMKLSGIGASRGFWSRGRPLPLGWRGSQVERTFYEPGLRLSLTLPSGWTVTHTEDPATLRLECPGRPGCGLLSLEPAAEGQTLAGFAAERFAGLLRQSEAVTETQIDGLPALEVEYEENVGGEMLHTRCLIVQRGSQMVMLSLVAEATRFTEARADFAALRQGLRFGEKEATER
jgi:hypothetical protein